MASQQQNIFREKALAHLVAPDHLDQLIQVTTPKGWLALFGLGGVLILALLWSIFGALTTTTTTQGILTRSGGLATVVALAPGVVRDIYVEVGTLVKDGQPIASLEQNGSGVSSRADVITTQTGRVLSVMAAKGDFVNVGAPLVKIEPLDQNLELVFYVPLSSGQNIRPEMQVQILPSTVSKEAYGFLRGIVRSVGDFPATPEGMKRILGTDELVKVFSTETAPIEVHVELLRDPNSPNGYQWSSSRSPAIELTTGTLARVTIILSQQRPINLLFR